MPPEFIESTIETENDRDEASALNLLGPSYFNQFTEEIGSDNIDNSLKHVFDEVVNECKQILINKNIEYSNSDNPYNQFETLASKFNIDKKIVWGIFFDKSIQAINRYCKESSVSSNETINNRIIDGINYLILFYGMVNSESK